MFCFDCDGHARVLGDFELCARFSLGSVHAGLYSGLAAQRRLHTFYTGACMSGEWHAMDIP
jgi:hypothetical protein